MKRRPFEPWVWGSFVVLAALPVGLSSATASAVSAGRASPAPPASTTGGGDNGTLVAVAVGGSCAFSVNGASKGTTSTLKLSLKPGAYTVTCSASNGFLKSKDVTVTSGGTAMAMFKL